MGYIAASTGTLFAAYAVYSVTARYVSQRKRGKAKAPASNGHAMKTADETLDIAIEKPNDPASRQPPPPTIPTVSPPPLSFELSPPAVEEDETTQLHSPQRKPPPTSMAPPPPPALQTSHPPRLKPTSMAPPPPRQPTIRSSSPPRLKPPSSSAPPRPTNTNTNSSMRPPPSAASTLRVPQTKALSNTHMQPASSTLGVPSTKSKARAIILAPGYSPLDWAHLTTSPSTPATLLRGRDACSLSPSLLRVTPSHLKSQTGRKGKDAWTSYNGKVYNITPYLGFHPGGKAEILKGAGRDSGVLFMEVHPWVNWDGMLGECCVGILVGEDDERAAGVNELDEMD